MLAAGHLNTNVGKRERINPLSRNVDNRDRVSSLSRNAFNI